MSWLDLHMHTHFSDDGTYSPEELMELCAQNGVRVAAVSDHNCTRGVARAVRHASSLGIECIPAVELDCTYQGIDLHLLGLLDRPGSPRLFPNGTGDSEAGTTCRGTAHPTCLLDGLSV